MRKLKISKERRGNVVDPASSHMLVSKTNSFSRDQISGFGAWMAIFTISRVKNLSTAEPCAKLIFREETKGNVVDPASSHMLVSKSNSFSRDQISGFGARMAIFIISRVKNLSTAEPCAKLKFREETKGTSATSGLANGHVYHHAMSSRPPRTEMSFPGETGSAGRQAASFSKPRWLFIKASFNINANGRFIKADGRFIMPM